MEAFINQPQVATTVKGDPFAGSSYWTSRITIPANGNTVGFPSFYAQEYYLPTIAIYFSNLHRINGGSEFAYQEYAFVMQKVICFEASQYGYFLANVYVPTVDGKTARTVCISVYNAPNYQMSTTNDLWGRSARFSSWETEISGTFIAYLADPPK